MRRSVGEMRQTPAVMTQSARTFSEREFYLAEFRGRSIGIAWPADVSVSERAEVEPLVDVIQELTANGSRVVLLSPAIDSFRRLEFRQRSEASDPVSRQLFGGICVTADAVACVSQKSDSKKSVAGRAHPTAREGRLGAVVTASREAR